MTTPSKEQVAQWIRAEPTLDSELDLSDVGFRELVTVIGVARSDLEAIIAEQVKEIEDIKGGMAYRNNLVGRLESERDQLRKQLEELAEAIRVKDALLSEIAKQTPEKPNYWSSCSQCERNSADAEDVLTIQPSPNILQARDQRVAEACAKMFDGDSEWVMDIPKMIRSGKWRKYL